MRRAGGPTIRRIAQNPIKHVQSIRRMAQSPIKHVHSARRMAQNPIKHVHSTRRMARNPIKHVHSIRRMAQNPIKHVLPRAPAPHIPGLRFPDKLGRKIPSYFIVKLLCLERVSGLGVAREGCFWGAWAQGGGLGQAYFPVVRARGGLGQACFTAVRALRAPSNPEQPATPSNPQPWGTVGRAGSVWRMNLLRKLVKMGP